MRIRAFEITRSQHGWVSECFFTETTASQFTDVELGSRAGSLFFVIAIIKSYFAAKRHAAGQRFKRGERLAKGWSE
jgi:DNA-binding MurR/RpiR family transcriptional regulator